MKSSIIPFLNTTDKILVKSKGCYKYDSNGKEYIDFEAGVWCTNIGHSPDNIVNTIAQQAKESLHSGYHFRNLPSEQLSEELQKLIGFKDGASVFLSSGSEAVNLAITIAQKISFGRKVLKIDNSYIGAYGYGQMRPDNEYLVNVKFNDLDAINNINFADISALVLETGGASIEVVQFPGYDFVSKLVKKAKENNCLIIAEEVTTGFGRTGKWFGFQNYNIIPDIVVTGKALGNGYPVSGVVVSDGVKKELIENIFIFGQSHINDPLGCAVGLEVIKEIKANNLIEKSKNIGEYFKDKLENLLNKYPEKIKEVRAKGLILALEFNENFNGETINKKLFEEGIITGFKLNTLRFMPPLVIEKKHIDRLVIALEKEMTLI